jgi:hypothetical protein
MLNRPPTTQYFEQAQNFTLGISNVNNNVIRITEDCKSAKFMRVFSGLTRQSSAQHTFGSAVVTG